MCTMNESKLNRGLVTLKSEVLYAAVPKIDICKEDKKNNTARGSPKQTASFTLRSHTHTHKNATNIITIK